MRVLAAFIVLFSGVAFGLEISLEPVSSRELGEWAQVTVPFRLHPTAPPGAEYEGPEPVEELWGTLTLGEAEYVLLLCILDEGEVALWISEDGRMEQGARLPGEVGEGHIRWDAELEADPSGGEPYTYELDIIWPEGRGYVFLEGGAPRRGEFEIEEKAYTVVLVDADVAGVFGTEGDLYAVDWTGDGRLHAEPGGHERFTMDEVVTIGERSYLVEAVAPDGSWIRFSETEYRPPKTPLVPGSTAPDFAFRPFRGGEETSLSDLRGRVVLLDFWATWCVPCMEGLPRLKTVYEDYHDEGFEIIGVSLDTSDETLRALLEERAIDWPQYFDGGGWDTEVAQLYRVDATPHMLLLDPEGVIQVVNPPLEELPSLIEDLLALSPREEAGDEVSPSEEPSPETDVQPSDEPEEDARLEVRSLWPWLALGAGAAVLLWVLLRGR